MFALRTVALGINGVRLAGLDGRRLFTQVAGGFTGRVAGTAFDCFACVPEP